MNIHHVGIENWKTYSVQELIDTGMLDKPLDGNHGELHPKTSDYLKLGVPFIMANNLINGIIDYNSCNYISDKQARTLKKGFAKSGDVLLTHKATIGRTAIVDNKFNYVVLTPQVTYYRVISGIDNKYLKYYFDGPYFQSTLSNWAGSGSTRAYLGITGQLKLPIILPPLPVQKKIASILSSLDDKIELNTRMNKVLEEIARALFHRWFVAFEFPNAEGKPYKSAGGKMVESEMGRVPEEWEILSLDKIAYFMNGIACQKYPPKEGEESMPVIKIRELRSGNLIKTDRISRDVPEKYYVQNGDVLFSWSASLLVDIWPSCEGVLNQHLFKVTSDKYQKWFYYFWTKYHLEEFQNIAVDKTTTMGHIKREHLNQAKVIVPNNDTLKRMDMVMAPIITKIIQNNLENITLSELRDELLPKLINGELSL